MLSSEQVVATIDRIGYRAALKTIRAAEVADERLRSFWGVAREVAEHIDDCLAVARWDMGQAGRDGR